MNWNDANPACADTRAAIADAVLGRVPIARDAPAARHEAECGACRAYRAECETLWSAMGTLDAPPPAPDARARFDAAVRRERRTTPHSFARRHAALAAMLLIGAMIGYGLRAPARVPAPASAAVDSTPRFLLLLYDPAGATPTGDAMKARIAEYSAWARGLAAAGSLVSAEKLADAPSEWFGGSVPLPDGARLGGFFLIRARDLREARGIAERCPHLKYGGRVELRPIHQT